MRLNNKLIILPLAAIMLLTGCSTRVSVENLLTAPKLTAEQSEIYRTLINSSGKGIKLKYPKSGEFRSAFVLQNIDDEPTDEALVFYEAQSVSSGESALRLKFLDKEDGEWQAVYDIACVGSEVESISFTTLGDSGLVDILVNCSMLNQTEKAVSVLNYVDRQPVERYASSYSCMEVIDLNSDGLNELVIVNSDKVNGTANAMMFANTHDGFVKLSEVPLDGTAADYVVTKGQLNEKITALFLDYSRGNGQYGTDVLYCYGNRLINPDEMIAGEGSSVISRVTNDYMKEINCRDIDNDGFIEIPSTTPLPGYETLLRPEQLCAVKWFTVEDNNFKQEYYSYFSSKYKFALLFPNRWCGFVTAVVNWQDNEIVFLNYDPASYDPMKGLEVTEENELLRIRTIDKDDIQGLAAARDMIPLGESEDSVYCYSVTTGYKNGQLALTASELENCFIIL